MKTTLTPTELEYFLNLKHSDITEEFMIENFFFKEKSGRKYDPSIEITIPTNRYKGNKTPIKTTLAIFIMNVLLFEEKLHDIVGYVNDEYTSKVNEMVEDKLDKALLNSRITVEDRVDFMHNIQWFGFQFNAALTPSLTAKTSKALKPVMKEKEKLLKANKAIIESGDAVEAVKIQKRLLDIARKEIGDDPGMELYESGSKASFDNNYSSLYVMKGPIVDTSTGKYAIATGNYCEGIPKKEFHMYADSLVNGAYAKGRGTQIGGYMTKKYFATFQSIVLDDAGTDCGSKGFLEVFLTKDNMEMFLYRYILEGSKMVVLDDEVMPKYIGRVVKMRDPLFCTSDKICNKCAGNLYYMLDNFKNIGLTTVKVSSSLMNKELKKFHDTSVKLAKMDLNDLVI